MRCGSLTSAALLCLASVAFPCGGSESYNVNGPLVSNASFAEAALSPMSDFEYQPRDEIRFLPGLLIASPKAMSPLVGRPPMQPVWWDTLKKPTVAEPSSDAMNAAWARGDVAAATLAARAVVDRVMALPASDDSARNAALRLAAETIDLAPVVAREPVVTRRSAFDRMASVTRAISFDSMPVLLEGSDCSSSRRRPIVPGTRRSSCTRSIRRVRLLRCAICW